MSVTSSALVAASSAPASVNDLWEPETVFRPDWSLPIEYTVVFSTAVSRARTVAEERRGMVSRPRRIVRASNKPMRGVDIGRKTSQMHRYGMARYPQPLWQDGMTVVSGSAPFNPPDFYIGERLETGKLGLTTPERLATREYHVGQRIVVVRWDGALASSATFAVITAIVQSSTTLYGLKTNPPLSPQLGDRVYPVIECLPTFEGSVELMTESIGQFELTSEESTSPVSAVLPARWFAGFTPAGFASYQGLPILHLRVDWDDVRTKMVRSEGEYETSGADRRATASEARPRFQGDASFMFFTKDDVLLLSRLFDSRCGRLYPFFVVSPDTGVQFISAPDERQVRVRAETLLAWMTALRTYIGVEVRGRAEPEVRLITEIEPLGGGEFNIKWDAGEPIAGLPSADVARVAWAHKVRFDVDARVMLFHSEERATTSLPVIELLEEKTVTHDIDDPVGPPWEPPDCNPGGCTCGCCVELPDGEANHCCFVGKTIAGSEDADVLQTLYVARTTMTWSRCVGNPLPGGGEVVTEGPCDPWNLSGQCDDGLDPCVVPAFSGYYSNASITKTEGTLVSALPMFCDGPEAETFVADDIIVKRTRVSGSRPCFVSPPELCTDNQIDPVDDTVVQRGGAVRYNQRPGSAYAHTGEWIVLGLIGLSPPLPLDNTQSCADIPSSTLAQQLLCELYLATLPHDCYDEMLIIDTGCVDVLPGAGCGYAREIFELTLFIARCTNTPTERCDEGCVSCV